MDTLLPEASGTARGRSTTENVDLVSAAQRPYVICHMGPSIDGRIVTTRWDSKNILSAEYERTAQTFDADAWIIGRVSMEPYAGKARVPRRKVKHRIPRKDFVADSEAGSYAIAVDPSGKLRWKSNAIDDEHIVTVISERVSDDYLAFLQSRRVSYLFGGRAEIDLSKVLVKCENTSASVGCCSKAAAGSTDRSSLRI